MRRFPVMLTLAVIAWPGLACAALSDGREDSVPSARRRVEQRIVDEPARILEQLKGSVCGNGPYYAGNVDNPVFVTPLFQTRCTLAPAAPDRR